MFGFFRRARTQSAAPRRRVTLRLEALEWRYQLDGTSLGDPLDRGDIVLDGGTRVAANVAPVIVDFQAEQLANGLFLLTGRVVDENPDGLVVTFEGSNSANGKIATADGTFSVTVQLRTDGTDSGFLGATTVDAQGLTSEEVLVFLDPTPVP